MNAPEIRVGMSLLCGWPLSPKKARMQIISDDEPILVGEFCMRISEVQRNLAAAVMYNPDHGGSFWQVFDEKGTRVFPPAEGFGAGWRYALCDGPACTGDGYRRFITPKLPDEDGGMGTCPRCHRQLKDGGLVPADELQGAC